jgi:NDP-sugar pyrophosphorylase family protein
MTVALIMAGGRSERMRPLGDKPLVAIRGATLLERNVWMLLRAGVRAIRVACRDEQRELRAVIERIADAARQRGVAITPLVESEPLGTIGAAGLMRGETDPLLVVNADNLTTLDLAQLVREHARSGADLTLATHDHAIRLPYGEVSVAGDRVTGYREKPTLTTRVASAVSVLGHAALAAIDGRCGLDELTNAVLARGGHVHACHHQAPWIDVTEPADVEHASALVRSHAEGFECWGAPDREVAGAVLRDANHLLLEYRPREACWDTPGGKLEPDEPPERAIARELHEELGLVVTAAERAAVFDSLERDGRIVRHHVFVLDVARAHVIPREGQTIEWFALDRLPAQRSPVVDRSLAGAA